MNDRAVSERARPIPARPGPARPRCGAPCRPHGAPRVPGELSRARPRAGVPALHPSAPGPLQRDPRPPPVAARARGRRAGPQPPGVSRAPGRPCWLRPTAAPRGARPGPGGVGARRPSAASPLERWTASGLLQPLLSGSPVSPQRPAVGEAGARPAGVKISVFRVDPSNCGKTYLRQRQRDLREVSRKRSTSVGIRDPNAVRVCGSGAEVPPQISGTVF